MALRQIFSSDRGFLSSRISSAPTHGSSSLDSPANSVQSVLSHSCSKMTESPNGRVVRHVTPPTVSLLPPAEVTATAMAWAVAAAKILAVDWPIATVVRIQYNIYRLSERAWKASLLCTSVWNIIENIIAQRKAYFSWVGSGCPFPPQWTASLPLMWKENWV